jgi:hypothetical protein
MAFLTTLGLLTSAAGAVKGFMSGSRQAAEGRRDLNKLEYQDLSIGAYDNVKPSLEMEQMQMNMINQNQSRAQDVASGLGGSEAIAMMQNAQQQAGGQQQQVMASMGDKLFGLEMKKAEDFQVRRGMQEQRDINTEDRARSQIQAGEQAQTSAIMGLGSMMMAAGNASELDEANDGNEPGAERNLRQMRRMNKLGIGADYDASQSAGERRQLIRDAGGGLFGSQGFFSKAGGAIGNVAKGIGGFFSSIF